MLFDFGDWRTSIDGLLFERLGVQEVVKLEEPFSGEQVLGALMGLNSLRDLRLLSLVGSLYKWLEKVLAYRLKKVVRKVISKA